MKLIGAEIFEYDSVLIGIGYLFTSTYLEDDDDLDLVINPVKMNPCKYEIHMLYRACVCALKLIEHTSKKQ